MSLEDSSVVQACEAISQVLRLNQAAAKNLAGLFDQYLYLLTDDTDALLLKFAEQAEPPSVDQYEEHLSSCQAAAETIRCGVACHALCLVLLSTVCMSISNALDSHLNSPSIVGI